MLTFFYQNMQFQGRNEDYLFTDTWLSDFDQCPYKAMTLYYLNSGLQVPELIHRLPKMSAKTKLQEEIESNQLSIEEKDQIVKRFKEARGEFATCEIAKCTKSKSACMIACGTCGIRTFCRGESEYKQVEISQIEEFLLLKGTRLQKYKELEQKSPLLIPVDDKFNTQEVDLTRLMGIYKSEQGELLNLHPEFVFHNSEGSESTFLCDGCYKHFVEKQIVAPLSLASGIDYGNPYRIGLQPLNLFERKLIAKMRLYHSVVKIKQKFQSGNLMAGKRMKGHAIMFPHNAPEATSFAALLSSFYNLQENFLSSELKEFCENMITIQFLGPEEEIDTMIQETLNTNVIQARPHVVQQWLLVLQQASTAGYSMDENISEMTESIQKLISLLNAHIIEKAQHETNEDIRNQEEQITDNHATQRDVGNSDSLSYSFVTAATNTKSKEDIMREKLQSLVSIAEAFEIEIDYQNKYQCFTTREKQPANKFNTPEYQCLLGSAFPDIFPLGKAYHSNANINRSQTRHLFLQYTCNAAECRELLFYLFNEEERKNNAIGISAAIKAGKLKDYLQLYKCIDFQNLLKEAVDDPSSTACLKVMKKVLPLLTLSKPVSQFSVTARTQCIARQLACHRRFGAAATFVTIAPNLQDDPLALRATFRSTSNFSFPATADETFTEALIANAQVLGESNIKLPVGYVARANRASSNPIAMAAEYQHLIRCVVEILFGIPPNNFTVGCRGRSNRTTYFKCTSGYKGNKFHQKGIFGHILAYYGTHEAQHRGTLHFHVILYGGISPEILDAVGGMDDLCHTVSKALNEMYKSEIPPSYHTARFLGNYQSTSPDLKQVLRKKNTQSDIPAFCKTPMPSNKRKWNDFTNHIVSKYMVHRHTFTCRKNQGKYCRCREAYKQRPVLTTKPVLLQPHDWQVYDEIQVPRDELPPIALDEIPPRKKQCIRNRQKYPLPIPEQKRCIYWDVQRRQLTDTMPKLSNKDPNNQKTKLQCLKHIEKVLQPTHCSNAKRKRILMQWLKKQTPTHVFDIYNNLCERLATANQYVVQHNPILTNAVKFNTNAILLGSHVQSLAATFYLTPYIAKGKVTPGTAFQAIYTSLQHVKEYPSVAKDSGTDQRTTQHWLTRILNTLSVQSEVSDQQAAFALLGNTLDTYTETFSYFAPYEHLAFVQKHKGMLLSIDSECTEEFNDQSLNEDDVLCEDVQMMCEHISAFTPLYNVIDSAGTKIKVPVPKVLHYNFRGEKLKYMNRLEYDTLIAIKPYPSIKPDSSSRTKGRKKSVKFPFAAGHPLCQTHFQYLKSLQPTPIIMGKPPVIPDYRSVSERQQRFKQRFAAYWLTLFRPEIHACTGPQGISKYQYDWDALVAWTETQEKSKLVHERLRFHSLSRMVFSLKTPTVNRDIINAYRREFSDILGQSTPNIQRKQQNFESEIQSIIDNIDTNAITETLSEKAMQSCILQTTYCNFQAAAIERLYAQYSSPPLLPLNSNLGHNPIILPTDLEHSLECFNNLQMEQALDFEDESTNCSQVVNSLTAQSYISVREFLQTKPLSRDQFEALDNLGLLQDFSSNQEAQHSQHLSILTGKPGAGKSYVIQTILEIGQLFPSITVVTTAQYGVAAVNAYGTTLHSLFNLRVSEKTTKTDKAFQSLTDQQLQLLRTNLKIDTLKYFIVDEFGVSDPAIFAMIDLRLKQALANDLPFGGVHVILVGDLHQLPSISGCLATTMLEYQQFLHLSELDKTNDITPCERKKLTSQRNGKFHVSSLWRKGCALLATFKRFHLTSQHRANDDVHMQLLTQMTEPDYNLDLCQFLSLYKPLTSKDFRENHQWEFAPYLVATNRERIQISHIQAIKFAKKHCTHVVRWPSVCTKWKNKPPNEADEMKAKEDPAFYQYFIPGAPAFMNHNTNPHLQLVNGTQMILHSLTPSTKEQETFIRHQQQSLPHGSIITLMEPPASIHVVPNSFSTHSPVMEAKLSTINNYLLSCSVETTHDGRPILPLFPGNSPTSQCYAKPINLKLREYTVPGSSGLYLPSKITVREHFPFDLGFAMTIHKAQGRTLNKIILCLTSRPEALLQMTLASLYVALSRVKHHNDIRILYHSLQQNTVEIEYLSFLNANNNIHCYYNGFQQDTPWNGQLAYETYRQSKT